MTFREQCALAVAEMVMAGLLKKGTSSTDAEIAPVVAQAAWVFADAMDAERRKREAAEAPTSWPHARDPAADLARAMEHLKTARNEELEKARREGRALAVSDVQRIARSRADLLHGNGAHAEAIHLDNLANDCSAMAHEASPDIASLQAELAKLRAVAEAAARLQRWRHSDQVSYAEGEQSDDALMATLDAALPNWRSAP